MHSKISNFFRLFLETFSAFSLVMSCKKQLITVAQAAEVLGRSKSAIYKALNDSPPRLSYADPLKRLLERQGLEERFARSTRPRADKPLAKPLPMAAEPAQLERTFDAEWEEIARVANSYLDYELWAPPPLTSQQWGVLAGVIDLARSSDA